MSIIAFPLHVANGLVQVKVDIERRAAQRAAWTLRRLRSTLHERLGIVSIVALCYPPPNFSAS
jgi:hypothetical protein